MELDSHANMIVLGEKCHLMSKPGSKGYATVSSFNPEATPLEIPLVDAVVAWVNPATSLIHLLYFEDVLYIERMKHHLLSPFLLREAGYVVNETARIHTNEEELHQHTHSIVGTDDEKPLCIPLELYGIFSFFDVCIPEGEEFNTPEERRHLMTPIYEWDPNLDKYADAESSYTDCYNNLIRPSGDRDDTIFDVANDPNSRELVVYETMKGKATSNTEKQSLVSEIVMADTAKKWEYDVFKQYVRDHGQDRRTTLRLRRPRPARTEDDMNISAVHVNLLPGGNKDMVEANVLVDALEAKQASGQIAMAVGSTDTWNKPFLFDIDNDIDEGNHQEATVYSLAAKRSDHVLTETLSKAWGIDYNTAKNTVKANSMYSPRFANKNMGRNITTRDRAMRYRHLNDHVFTDTMFATKKAAKSYRGNTCAQIIVTDKGYIGAYPMKTKGEATKSIKLFCKEIGIPTSVICDPAREQSTNELKQYLSTVGATLRLLEQGTQWANRAELVIGQLKASVRSTMRKCFCPLVLWDYCLEWHARINNMTAKNLFQLKSQTPFFTVHGREGDISNLAMFSFYDWVYFKDNTEAFPMCDEILGRYLGPTEDVGSEMTSWILKSNGKVVPRRTLRPLNDVEERNEKEMEKRDIFDKAIAEKLGIIIKPEDSLKRDDPMFDLFNLDDDEEYSSNIPEADELTSPPTDASGTVFDQQPLYDKLINAEVQLPHGDEYKRATVIGRTIDMDGKTKGTHSDNPFLDTITYDVLFPDGAIKQYSASTIAENMLSQVDEYGFQYNLLEGIIDHKKDDNAITKETMYWINKKTKKKHLRKTTIGWKLKVLWRDGTEQWVPLKDLKESNPIEVAEYAKAQDIATEPAFRWWLPYVLKRRDRLITAVKARVRKTTHKYGIEIPTSIQHAFELDRKNGNTIWRDAIRKEMTNVGIAFDILEHEETVPVGYEKVTGHIIFDVKMDFTRKARWVLDGHKCPQPDMSTYAGVVSRESVRIALTYAALNDLDVYAADIQNAYLQAPSSMKHFIICGPEFGIEHEGKKALIVRALYGGKTAGRDFRNYFRECMVSLGFESCKADPDVWLRKAVGPKGPHWEYVLLYTDDALVVADNPEKILREEIGKHWTLKEKSIGPPKIYLGGKVRKVKLENGQQCWGYSSAQYVQNAVKNVEDFLSKRGSKLPMRGKNPISTGYRPEIDVSPPLEPSLASYYQSLIGILRWIVELGRIDICCEVSLMSSQLVLPREGHLDQVFHIFAYLKRNHNAELVFDPTAPDLQLDRFMEQDWSTSEMGFVGKEELPKDAPEARGNAMIMRAFVDADHAGDLITRRSRTGFLIYLMTAPIYWLSKKQTSVETSSFGSEFVAMKQCTEYVKGLRYKLRMMGIAIDGPTYIFGDNQSVLYNTTIPDSTLKKKAQSICYHYVREGAARGEWRTTYINTRENPADLLTKSLSSGELRRHLTRMILYHIYGNDDEVEE